MENEFLYNGMCVVHAYYEGVESSNILNESKDLFNQNKIKKYFKYDFNNTEQDIFSIRSGIGYIRTILDKQYVITCEHIMVDYSTKYIGYCKSKLTNKLLSFNMIVYKRIPEIDIIIMKIKDSELREVLPELKIDNNTNIMNTKNNNKIIIPKYVEDNNNEDCKIKYKEYNIDSKINIIYHKLKSDIIDHLPLYELYLNNIVELKYIFEKYNINFNNINEEIKKTQYQELNNILRNKLRGISGSILQVNNSNIGMVVKRTTNNKGIKLLILPLFLINLIVDNYITNDVNELKSIVVKTDGCEIEYDGVPMYGHYIKKKSCPYINGKRIFTFNEGDIILQIDNKYFNNSYLIFSEIMKSYVPITTYLMLKSLSSNTGINIKTCKQYTMDNKIRNYNLLGIPYNNMQKLRITNTISYIWRKLIFIELSEELIKFYKNMNIDIITANDKINTYESNNKRIVILFNYNNRNNIEKLDINYYKKLPIKCPHKNSYYFYVLTMIGKRKINNIKDLQKIINLDMNKRKKIILKFQDFNYKIKNIKFTPT